MKLKMISAPTVLARLVAPACMLLCLGLAACAEERPQSTFTKGLDTGITASDGGGMRALGNQPNATVTSRVSPSQPPY